MNHPRRDYSQNRVSRTVVQRASLGQQAFHQVISLERRRAERSRKSFLLMLVDAGKRPFDVSQRILAALMLMTRETDIVGWYREGTVASVLFTEIADDNVASTTTAIMNRVSKTLKNHLSTPQFKQISVSFQLLPEQIEHRPSSFHATAVAGSSMASASVAVELP